MNTRTKRILLRSIGFIIFTVLGLFFLAIVNENSELSEVTIDYGAKVLFILMPLYFFVEKTPAITLREIRRKTWIDYLLSDISKNRATAEKSLTDFGRAYHAWKIARHGANLDDSEAFQETSGFFIATCSHFLFIFGKEHSLYSESSRVLSMKNLAERKLSTFKQPDTKAGDLDEVPITQETVRQIIAQLESDLFSFLEIFLREIYEERMIIRHMIPTLEKDMQGIENGKDFIDFLGHLFHDPQSPEVTPSQ